MIAVAEKELNCFCFWPNVQADTFTSYCMLKSLNIVKLDETVWFRLLLLHGPFLNLCF